jgi:TRAP-type C4-dicarboxylate transport system substrate-binding protein
MKSKKFLVLLSSIGLILMLTLAPTSTPAAPIELKLVTFLPTHVTSVGGAKAIAAKIKQTSKGQLIFKVLGGPEIMSGRDQPAATVKGVIDIAYVPTSYFPDLVPGIDIISLSKHRKAADERRPGGIYDAMQELHNKAGLYFIGRESGINADFFYNLLRKPVKKLSDLKGFKIGATIPKYKRSWKALGIAFSVIPGAESYTAMERGVVDGFNYPIENHVDMGLHEAGKYLLDHGFFCDNVVGIMNLKVWKGLSPELKKAVIEAQIAVEKDLEAAYSKTEDESRKKMSAAGVKFIKFSSADAARYLDAYYSNELAEQKKKFPNIAPRLAELLGW